MLKVSKASHRYASPMSSPFSARTAHNPGVHFTMKKLSGHPEYYSTSTQRVAATAQCEALGIEMTDDTTQLACREIYKATYGWRVMFGVVGDPGRKTDVLLTKMPKKYYEHLLADGDCSTSLMTSPGCSSVCSRAATCSPSTSTCSASRTPLNTQAMFMRQTTRVDTIWKSSGSPFGAPFGAERCAGERGDLVVINNGKKSSGRDLLQFATVSMFDQQQGSYGLNVLGEFGMREVDGSMVAVIDTSVEDNIHEVVPDSFELDKYGVPTVIQQIKGTNVQSRVPVTSLCKRLPDEADVFSMTVRIPKKGDDNYVDLCSDGEENDSGDFETGLLSITGSGKMFVRDGNQSMYGGRFMPDPNTFHTGQSMQTKRGSVCQLNEIKYDSRGYLKADAVVNMTMLREALLRADNEDKLRRDLTHEQQKHEMTKRDLQYAETARDEAYDGRAEAVKRADESETAMEDAEKKLVDTYDEIDRLKDTIRELEQKKTELEKNIADLDQRKTDAESSVANSEGQLRQANHDLQSAQQAVRRLEASDAAKNRQLADAQVELDKLKKDKETAEAEKAASEKGKQEADAKAEAAEQGKVEAEQAKEAAEARLELAVQAKEAAEADKAAAEQDKAAAEQDKAAAEQELAAAKRQLQWHKFGGDGKPVAEANANAAVQDKQEARVVSPRARAEKRDIGAVVAGQEAEHRPQRLRRAPDKYGISVKSVCS